MDHYIVAVCTAKRPLMLRRCLESIAAQTPVQKGKISAVVVENDGAESCRSVCEEVTADTGLPIHYALETTRGIPFARNRALEECIGQGADWIALIDDDETARSDWLRLLAEACEVHSADVANGPVHRIYEEEAPYWWKKQLLGKRKTGEEISEAPTNNILMSSRVVREDGLGLRFEEKLINGAEDIDFFRRAKAAGTKMIWVDEAFVDEEIPASRVQTSRLLNRLVMAACSGTQMKILRRGYGVAIREDFFRALKRMIVGAIATLSGAPVRALLGKKGGKLMWYGITRAAKGYGNVKGLAGNVHEYYTKIDGS